MRLVFKNSNGKERTIANVENEKDAFKQINEFCSERDYKVPYYRSWEEDGAIWVDCGSWSEFFLLYPDEESNN